MFSFWNENLFRLIALQVKRSLPKVVPLQLDRSHFRNREHMKRFYKKKTDTNWVVKRYELPISLSMEEKPSKSSCTVSFFFFFFYYQANQTPAKKHNWGKQEISVVFSFSNSEAAKPTPRLNNTTQQLQHTPQQVCCQSAHFQILMCKLWALQGFLTTRVLTLKMLLIRLGQLQWKRYWEIHVDAFAKLQQRFNIKNTLEKERHMRATPAF